MKADIAIIGGSGVYDASMLDNVATTEVDTPFGQPSDAVTIGAYGDLDVAFIPRHGAGHRVSPSMLNSRANIYALKKLGVERIIAASAVGSLREEIEPLHIVVPDQIFDRTKSRPSTFFEDGIVAHIGFADPFCPSLNRTLSRVIRERDYRLHEGGTYVCMEGPQFSTRAESEYYRSFGFDVIGMTALPEAKLAREAEICYSMIATVTDYDVWHEEDVDIETVIENAQKNEAAVREIIRATLDELSTGRDCPCQNALMGAIATSPESIPIETRRQLWPLISKYMEEQ